MAKREERNVLTFHSDYSLIANPEKELHTTLNDNAVRYAYTEVNEAVNRLARMVTIHSISYNTVGYQDKNRLYATVLYAGPSAFELFNGKSPYTKHKMTPGVTLIPVTVKGLWQAKHGQGSADPESDTLPDFPKGDK